MTRWGIVSTIKAPTQTVLDFVAFHLAQGADHLFIYLDDENQETADHLNAHPKVTALITNAAYWGKIGAKRSDKHQVRQTVNASHAYCNAEGLDWLAHIDVDEFLCPDATSVSELLSSVPDDIMGARVRPAEKLVVENSHGLDPATTYCKAWFDRKELDGLETTLYPNFGDYLNCGFVSHTMGKTFIRTGLGRVSFRIHRALIDDQEVGPRVFLKNIDLCHTHISDWPSWQKSFQYRLEHGSYRAELTKSEAPTGMSMHDLFSFLQSEGEDALIEFYQEVCTARPDLLHTLSEHNLLREYHLDLGTHRKKHFPFG